MGSKRFTSYVIFFAFLLSVMIVSCQKDQDIKDDPATQSLGTDSTAAENYLALKGTLKITIQDSTYTFDASNDSIAFVNVHADNNQYFGITAINKAHNMSFGISSPGYALSNISTVVSGSQFLLTPENKPNTAYALTQYATAQDFGKINLFAYKQDSVLAKGTFYTFLAKDAKSGSPAVRVKGTFSLQLK
jgi:hypothetical protein